MSLVSGHVSYGNLSVSQSSSDISTLNVRTTQILWIKTSYSIRSQKRGRKFELEILNLKGKCLKNIEPCRSDRGQLSITLVVGGTQTTPLSATKTRTSDTFISLEKLSFRFS